MIRKAIIVVLTFATVGTPLAWAVSYRAPQGWNHTASSGGVIYNFVLNRGTVQLWRWKPPPSATMIAPDRSFSFAGFGLFATSWFAQGNPIKATYRAHSVRCRFWFLLILFAVYPALAFIRGPFRQHRCRKRGRCLACGYNLTGNVSGVCPECATKVEQP